MVRAALFSVGLLMIGASAFAQDVLSAPGATIRALDKITGDRVDIDIRAGQTLQIGRLQVKLEDCRYQTEGEAQVAFAFLVIVEPDRPEPQVFAGWMSSDSPALNPLDHPRYDLWLMRCSAE
jgi:hypothetical protein